jgi:hypothetical protein
VGQLTSAGILLAGSVTESGSSFLLNGRLIDVETGVVIGARSVSVARDELISEAEAFKYEYVTRYGLGFQPFVGVDFPAGGIPRSDTLGGVPTLIHTGAGVSYRPWRFLQIVSSLNVTWSEFQYGQFDPTSGEYDNTDWLFTYYDSIATVDTSLPSYSIEYSQRYLDVVAYYVWQPLKPLVVSFGGGGLLGMYTNSIEMRNYPIYIGPVDPISGDPTSALENLWIRQNVVVEGGNALTYGLLAAAKVEYFFSPRIALSLSAIYRLFLPTQAYQYTFGGILAGEDDEILQLSGWVPGKTPYGDDVDIRFHAIGVFLGISGSF